MTSRDRPTSPFFHALASGDIWRRAAPIGFAVGLFQAAVNQGDHWLQHDATPGVILKTILSPLIGLTLSVVSAAAAQVKTQKTRADTP